MYCVRCGEVKETEVIMDAESKVKIYKCPFCDNIAYNKNNYLVDKETRRLKATAFKLLQSHMPICSEGFYVLSAYRICKQVAEKTNDCIFYSINKSNKVGLELFIKILSDPDYLKLIKKGYLTSCSLHSKKVCNGSKRYNRNHNSSWNWDYFDIDSEIEAEYLDSSLFY